MVQFRDMGNGAFVVHKLTGRWSGVVSAWFDEKGNLVDACHRRARAPLHHAGRNLPKNGPMWREIEAKGRAYRPVTHKNGA